MTGNLVVYNGAWPAHTGWRRDSEIAVSTRLCLLAADLDRAAAAALRVAGEIPRGFFRRSAGCSWKNGFLAKRASRRASSGNDDDLPCRGTSLQIAVPNLCGGLARWCDLRRIARRIVIAGAPALPAS